MSRDLDVLVIGAGVVGLTTGICLLEAGASVVIVSPIDPSETTSALATAMVGPTFGFYGERASAWEAETVRRFLADQSAPGVHVCRGRFVARPAGFVPPAAEALQGYTLCAGTELPSAYQTCFWVEVPLVDMPRYLTYLTERFASAGGRLQRGSFVSLGEAVGLVPLVANCSGLGARELVPDADVTPLRGPKIVVENPGIDTFLIEGPPGPQGTSFHPHGDVVVLGGSATESWDTTPDRSEEQAIIERCSAIEPRLARARVIEHRVGLRPSRPHVRVDVEQLVGGRVVHNYGHGGVGVTLSWGCAAEAASILLEGPAGTA